MSKLDVITVDELEVFAYHGVMPEENVVGQKFCVSVSMYTDIAEAGRRDDIDMTVNYAGVCEDIKKFVEGNTFRLIESVAQKLADMLLKKYKTVHKITVEIKKPWAPIHLPVNNVSVKIERARHDAYLSLGSNMGDRKRNLDKAIEALRSDDCIEVCGVADYIVTAPVGFTEQDDFLNTAVKIKTLHSPHELLTVINKIEEDGERKRELHWGPRTIDIDIILYDNLVIGDETLNIPHPEMLNREFVLRPLAQIAPYALHPVRGKNVSKLLEEFYENEKYVSGLDYEIEFQGINSLPVEPDTKIAYFGTEGTYSQRAMESFFGEGGYKSFAIPSFTDVMRAVESGEANYGVVPIENSSTGGITDIYDHIGDYNIYIVGEQIIKIEHALLGLPGSCVADIKKVYSHIQGIMQCPSFFEAHPDIKPVEKSSTAEGARLVVEGNDRSVGAIAGVQAARVYGLEILENVINDRNNNSTRFVILSGKKTYIDSSRKISISFELKHESGALYRILSHFYHNGINLEKIESRPIPEKTWEYRFFVDIAGNLKMQGVKNALSVINRDADNVRIIGNY
ncbi:MAG: prephenate dehydratase [Lachnospiraceae bacterium]|nr:prephenate dehydratase [Lachnospiraceae bacterium]